MVGVPVSFFKCERTVLTCYTYEHTSIGGFYYHRRTSELQPCSKYEHPRFCGFRYEPTYHMVGVAVRFAYDHTVLTCFKFEHSSIWGSKCEPRT